MLDTVKVPEEFEPIFQKAQEYVSRYFDEKKQGYKNDIFTFKVRGKEINIKTHVESLSHIQIPKICILSKKIIPKNQRL